MSARLVDEAFVFRAGLAIDADGSPHAYHPDSKSGLDYLANAGREGKWWGLACDKAGIPYIQKSTDIAPGFYVSTTSLFDPSKPDPADPKRYVDSETVPYVTTDRDMRARGCRLGDVGLVFHGALQCAAVVADVGPAPGEGSIALAKALGVPANPRHGGVSHPNVSYILFRGSSKGWPCTHEDITTQATELFDKWGGLERLAKELV